MVFKEEVNRYILKKIILALAIIAFIIFTHWGMLPGYLMQPSDGARSVYTDYHWIAKELASGKFPTWMPYYYGGIPFPCYGGGVLDINLVPFFFFAPDTAATIMMLAQMFGLFIVLFWWFRILSFSEATSFWISGLVIWSGPLLFWYGYGYPYNSYIYAVLSMIFLEMYYRRRNGWYLFLLALVVAMSSLSMSIQHQLNVPLAILLVSVVRIFIDRKLKPLLLTILFIAIGYSMASIHILPLFFSLREIGREGFNYGETFHFPPLSLMLGILCGDNKEIQYPAFYFFIPSLLIIGFIMFFIRKGHDKYTRNFVFAGSSIFIFLIAPLYLFPLIFPAFRIADPYRQWFILVLTLAVASASVLEIVWKDIKKEQAGGIHYWIASTVAVLILLLFKWLEGYWKQDLLSFGESVSLFLLPVAALPFLFFIRRIWIRCFIIVALFMCNYLSVGYHVQDVYMGNLSKNPDGYKKLVGRYSQIAKGMDPSAVLSEYMTRYWGPFDKVGPLEPSVSSLIGMRSDAGPTGFLFLPGEIRKSYYDDGIIAPANADFWRIVYPEMISADARVLAGYGIQALLVNKDDLPEFAAQTHGLKLAALSNSTREQMAGNNITWDVDSAGGHRFYILSINRGCANTPFLSLAELVFYNDHGVIPSSGIKVFADSSLDNHVANNLIDGDLTTFWHVSLDRAGKKHMLLFDFKHKTKIRRITAWKRQSYNDQFWGEAYFYPIPDKYVMRMDNGRLSFNLGDKVLPGDWSPFSSYIDDKVSFIVFHNKMYRGRAYSLGSDNQIYGLPIIIDMPNHVIINTRGLPKGTRVILADNYFDGWNVKINGAWVQPDKPAHFRRVVLPAESSAVEWVYSSGYVRVGSVMSFVSLLTGICCAVILNRNRKYQASKLNRPEGS